MFLHKRYVVFFLFTVLLQQFFLGQTKNDPTLEINQLISDNKLDEAQLQTDYALVLAEADNYKWNVGELVYVLGKIELLRNVSTNFDGARNLVFKFENLHKPDSVMYRSYMDLGLLYDEQGTAVKALENIQKAAKIAQKSKEPYERIETEYYLSEMSLKTGDFNQIAIHTNNALELLKLYSEIKHPLTPRIYNYKASISYFSGQLDSANFYFQKALAAIPNLKNTAENKYYLPATIYGNWFLVKQSEGDYDTAMEFTLKCIKYHKLFLKEAPNDPLARKVQNNLSIAYRNLGSLYNDMGYKEKAKQVAKIGYIHAKKHFLPNTITYFSAILMLGEAYLYSDELDNARIVLLEAENSLKKVPGENLFYYSNFYGVMANLENRAGDYKKAIDYYKMASQFLLKSNQNEFSQNLIFNEISLAEAYAKNNEPLEASTLIKKILLKTKESFGNTSYLVNSVKISQARIEFINKNYPKTIETCNQIIGTLSNKYGLSETNILYYQTNLAEIFLLKAEANYKLLGNKTSEDSYKTVLEEINNAIRQLEKEKTITTSRDEVAVLIENNQQVFDFAKKINLELYQKTKSNSYLKKILELHESSIYNRIRARLNLNEDELTLIPKNVANHERALKHKINSLFEDTDNLEINIDSLEQAEKNWSDFLKLLKQQYPKYYDLRYASILQNLGTIKNRLPKQTTLVRYLFVENELYAYVLDEGSENLFQLSFDRNENKIQSFKNFNSSIDSISNAAFELYQQLWKPFENRINTANVVILPDAELYNLPFELLTADKINKFKELSTKSLLHNYNISYDYSLLISNNNQKNFDFDQDFIAFVPGFTDKMKNEYELSITDSLDLDKTYLHLLPQPFTSDLVKQVGNKYSGTSFLNEQASKQLFINNAQEHKIIHIGTHAESDNINPELSRLVFAKNLSDTSNKNDNYLYAFEIYNLNLNAELAVLTACETGKPTYQPGEGMISLAHAFNYAGSESILTSLWEIDEKSSTEILNYFYKYLSESKRKDEALRLAKLDYLKNADGRTVHPQYWAGLILMGNTDPVALSQHPLWVWVLIMSLAILGVVILVFYLKKNARGKYQRHYNN